MRTSCLALALIAVTCPMCCTQTAYMVVDLGSYGGPLNCAYDVDDLGHVVGALRDTSWEWHGFEWDAANGLRETPSIIGNAINNAGQIAGMTTDSRAALREPDGVVRHVNELPSQGRDINDQGQLVGYELRWGGSYPPERAFIWDERDGLRYLDTLSSRPSFAEAINNSGQVVGYLDSEPRPFIWDAIQGVRDLSISYGWAHDINNLGQVVGEGRMDIGQPIRGFIWDPLTGVQWLGYAFRYGFYSAINDHGLVVGQTDDQKPFGWSAAMGIFALPLLPDHRWGAALGVNNSGWIVGTSEGLEDTHAVLWVPVPEPTALASLGLGVILLSGVGPISRRRAKRLSRRDVHRRQGFRAKWAE